MITKLETLAELFRRLPRTGRLVLCHGCWDVLHPGHIRHLQHAKDRESDTLVVSVTTDRFVNKGASRPYVPDYLRAEMLEALELVDFVILTGDTSAAKIIEVLKPDVFAKGADYADRHDPRTAEEQAALDAYGGQMIFTSGEVTFSSTVLGAPRISIPDFSGLRVHVIGDAIRDVYTQATCLGAASKSPTLVYERGESQEWIGGAGVVAAHCRAAGATVGLSAADATIKERILVEGTKVCEFHTRPDEDRAPRGGMMNPDIVIYADFQHGMFTPESLRFYQPFRSDTENHLTAADSQTTDISWGNILDFAGCDLLFANEREARFALKDQTTQDIGPKLWEAAQAKGTKAVFLKLGGRGLLGFYDGGRQEFPAMATQPIVDPIGAGDALLAYATLTYAVTKDLELAGTIGSLAAAEACAHLGNEPVTLDAIQRRAREVR